MGEIGIEPAEVDSFLTALFDEVDAFQTGNLRASALLNKLKCLSENADINRWDWDELIRFLDPNKDDRYVDKELFKEVGKKWINKVKDGKFAANDTSLGLLDSNLLLDTSFGSLEGIGGRDLSGGNASQDLLNENKELQNKIKRLSEEKTSLQDMVTAFQDEQTTLQLANDNLKEKLAATSNNLDLATSLQKDYDNIKSFNEKSGGKCSRLKKELENSQNKLTQLVSQNQSLQDEFFDAQSRLKEKEFEEVKIKKEFEVAKLKLLDLQEDLNDKKEFAQALTQEKIEYSSKLEEKSTTIQRLEMKLESLNAELSNKEEELKNFTLGMGSKIFGEVGEVSFDEDAIWNQLNSPKKEAWNLDPILENGDFSLNKEGHRMCPAFSSTPFTHNFRGRGSIGDEIKKLGLKGMPLIDKSQGEESSQCSSISKMDKETCTIEEFKTREVKDINNNIASLEKSIQTEQPLVLRFSKILDSCEITLTKLLALFGFWLMFMLIVITFFGAIEWEDKTYYPITWYSSFPEPYVFIKKHKVYNVW